MASRFFGRFALVAAGLVAAVGLTNQAVAQGASCATLAGTNFTVTTPPGPPNGASFPGSPFSFEAGDVLQFKFEALAGGPFDVDVSISSTTPAFFDNPQTNLAAGGTVTITDTITVTSSDYSFSAGIAAGTGTVRVTFLGCANGASGDSASQLDSQAATAAAASFAQQSGLVFSRTNNLLLNKPQNRVDPSLNVSALPQAGVVGGAGHGADAFGVWGDFTWSGLQNDDANVGSDAHVFTLTGGYDTPITDRLIAGAAISFGGAIFDAKNSAAESSEINFGVTPYLAYQIDDVFALQAAAGYTHARGSSDVTGDEGDFGVNRYFVAGEASAFQTWDEFALFGSVGLLWGQSFQARYTDDSNNRAGSVKTQLGSVSVTAQPSYLFTVDEADGAFIEPYLLGQYSYDFSQSKVRGAANDPDEFLLGAGANAFHGNGMSGALEFTRSVGREDQSATSARATVRMDF